MKRILSFLILGITIIIGALSSNYTFAQENSCELLWGGTLYHGESVSGWKLSVATFTESCDSVKGTLTCNDGNLEGGKNIYIESSCYQPTWKGCTTNNGSGVDHLGYFDFYRIGTSEIGETCLQAQVRFQCLDGDFIKAGYDIDNYRYDSCNEVVFADCRHPWESRFVSHNTILHGYTGTESTSEYSCEEIKSDILCQNSVWKTKVGDIIGENADFNLIFSGCDERAIKSCIVSGYDEPKPSGWTGLFYSSSISDFPQTCEAISSTFSCSNGVVFGDYSRYPYTRCNNGDAENCSVGGTTIIHGLTGLFYSSFASAFPQTCDDLSSVLGCNDGTVIGNSSTYKYSDCAPGIAKSCDIIWKDSGPEIIGHGSGTIGFSAPIAIYPKTCDQISTNLSCDNGNIVGNRDTFNYKGCIDEGGLVMGIDLQISAKLAGGNDIISQYSSPALVVNIRNGGMEVLNGSNIDKGFLSCFWDVDDNNSIIIFESKPLAELTINPGTSIVKTAILKDIFTQSLGDKNIRCQLLPWTSPKKDSIENNIREGTLAVVSSSRFDIAMDRSILSIKDNLDSPEIKKGAEGVKDFLMEKVMNILVPLVVTLGILIAILGFYKILFSNDEKAIDEGVKYLTYGVIGIIVIMSAKFISNTMYSDVFNEGILAYNDVQGFEIAQTIYEKIAFPFIKIAIYLSLGALFVILASRMITFIFAENDDTKKKAGTIIAWNVIGMLIIIGAKQIVEFIYGKQETVVKAVSNLGEIGTGVLADKNLPILYDVINWAMGLASLVILIMVLVQAFQLLLKPDDPDSMKKIKNSLFYIVIGILIIGTGYIITNFLIIN